VNLKKKNNKFLFKNFAFIILMVLVVAIITYTVPYSQAQNCSGGGGDGFVSEQISYLNYYADFDVNAILTYYHNVLWINLSAIVNTNYPKITFFEYYIKSNSTLIWFTPDNIVPPPDFPYSLTWDNAETVESYGTVNGGTFGATGTHGNILNKTDLPLTIGIEIGFVQLGYSGIWEYGYMDSSLINSSGGGSCIAGSIPILLSNGTYELARYIKIGDEVSTYNINNHNIENGIITGIKSTYESSCYIINGNLIIAPNQTILTLNGYISAEDLTLNDSLYNIYTNSFINIYSILKINQSEIMFDFMISINSNFIGIYYVLGDTIIC